jgi:hypothetical protein
VNRAGCSQDQPAISLPMECKQYLNECSKVNVDVVRLGVNHLFKCRDSKHCYLCSRSPKITGNVLGISFCKSPPDDGNEGDDCRLRRTEPACLAKEEENRSDDSLSGQHHYKGSLQGGLLFVPIML